MPGCIKITPDTKWIDYVHCVCVCVKQFYLTSAFIGHNYSPTCDVAVKNNLFPDFFKSYCHKTAEATIMKIEPNESKLIYAINIFTVASLCLLLSYGSHLNTTTH